MRLINQRQQGSVLLCTICAVLVLSLIGANVLYNSAARYNSTVKQVKAWKDALVAAEAGGDLGYDICRKTIGVDSAQLSAVFTSAGWTIPSPAPANPTWTKTLSGFGQDNSLSTVVTIDQFKTNAPYFRIRSVGKARVFGLTRTALDDHLDNSAAFDPTKPFSRGAGASLLRKIDFKVDHFIATYGYGDALPAAAANGTNGKSISNVTNPQVSRRVELVTIPLSPFEVAIKVSGNFIGLGAAGYIDSFRSTVGNYDATVKTNPADSRYVDARSGSVQINKNVAAIGGKVYGNVLTNGGSVTWKTTNVLGVIDNTVPFQSDTLIYLPTTFALPQGAPTNVSGNTSITPPAAGTSSNPTVYQLGTWNKQLTINPVGGAETYVAIHATSDITGSIHVVDKVHVRIYFDRDISLKARDLVNDSGAAGDLQFFGAPPNPNTSQSIDIQSPGDFAAAFYAPNANFSMAGNPDVTGAIVAKSFDSNGNTSWHFDRSLEADAGIDYRVASYIEDVR